MSKKITSNIFPVYNNGNTFLRIITALVSLVAPIIGVLLLASILYVRLTKLLEDTLFRITVSILCVCILIGTLILIFIPLGYLAFWAISICISLIIFKWFNLIPFRNLGIKNIFNKTNIGSVLGFVFSIIIISLSLWSSVSSYGIFSKIYGGEDNSAHVGMIKYNLDHHTPTYFDANSGIDKGLQTYPQGIHTATAYTIWAFNPYISVRPSTMIALYYAFFLLGVILFFIVISAIIRHLFRSSASTPLILLACAATYTLSVRYIISYGFYTQLYCFVFLLAAILIGVILHENMRRLKEKDIWILYGILMMLCIGVASTWYLFVATLLFPILIIVFTLFKKSLINTLIISFVAGLVSLFYVLINLKNTASSNALLASGATYAYTDLDMLIVQFGAVLLIPLIFIYIFKGHSRRKSSSSIIILAFAASAYFLSFVIRFYQYIHHVGPSYYYFKSLYLLTTVAFLLLPLALRLIPKQLAGISFSIITLFIGYVIGVSLPPTSFNTMISRTPTNIPPTYLQLLNTANSTKTDLFVASSCSPYDSYLATKWSGMLLNTYNTERDRITFLSVREIIGDKTAHAKNEMMNYASKNKALSLDLDPATQVCVNK